jgi:16S rRNA (cytosine1402-N4)-methyltransferase
MSVTDETPHGHEPVMVEEVLQHLDPQPGDLAVDCTLGRGGHASLLLERTNSLVALEQDPENLQYATRRLGEAELHQANFGDLARILDGRLADVLLADLGVSTNQLVSEEKGLSFAHADAPLDMRLDPTRPLTAADALMRWPEKLIADTIYQNAGERFSRRIARKIVERRKSGQSVRTAGELAELVRRCVPRGRNESIDPATRTFMALRMAVNEEVHALERLLAALSTVMAAGGRLVFISFHSGEDRLVKNALREAKQRGKLEILTKKPLVPSDEEVERNPRSRSAKLRAARWL